MWLRLTLPKGLFIAAFFCALLLGASAAYLGYWFSSSHRVDAPGETFVVHQGWPLQTIANELEAKSIIFHPRFFSLMARLFGDATRIHAGEYVLSADMSPAAILKKFTDGDVILYRVTLPEGMTSAQFVDVLNGIPELEGKITDVPAEGTLMPETYTFQRGMLRSTILEEVQGKMSLLVDKLWESRPADTILKSKMDFITLASIVEKETAAAAERPLIAAVFLNRLKLGMPLQADPTVVYGLTKGKCSLGKRLLKSDLQTPSPYNTYLNPGLPPRPIANPGKEALQAVMNPAPVNYLYFVANGPHSHVFASNLAEHNKNHSNWRRIRSKQDATSDK